MNSPRRGTPDFLLLFLTFLLVCIGLAFVFSASVAMNDPWSLVIRQGLAVGLGTVIMFFCMNVDFRKFQKWVAPFLTFSIVLLLLVPIVGREVNNAKSWIYIGSFGLQPTELAKLAVILYLAALLSKKGDKIHDFKRGLVPPLLVVGFLCMLIMFQPDLGSTMIVVLSAALVIVVGGASIKHIMLLGAAGASALALLASVYLLKTGGDSYRVDRFTTFLDPFADPQGGSFQIIQSLYAFGHGGLTGAGFGQSVQKLHYLPEAHNDFIFSIIGEELGFIGSSIFFDYLFSIPAARSYRGLTLQRLVRHAGGRRYRRHDRHPGLHQHRRRYQHHSDDRCYASTDQPRRNIHAGDADESRNSAQHLAGIQPAG